MAALLLSGCAWNWEALESRPDANAADAADADPDVSTDVPTDAPMDVRPTDAPADVGSDVQATDAPTDAPPACGMRNEPCCATNTCRAALDCVYNTCHIRCRGISEVLCGSNCRDLSRDNNNCGACDQRCPSGTGCVDGVCR